jgi:hypothetical protein
MNVMRYTRLYADEQGESHFEDISVPLKNEGTLGYLSENFEVKWLRFRVNEAGYDWDYHNAPARQFIILLDGGIEITTSRGEARTFSGGDILLVEDTYGKGHKTRNIKKQIRKSVFIGI